MIYVVIKTFLNYNSLEKETVNNFIDHLELTQDKLATSPSKEIIKIILEDTKNLDEVERYIKTNFGYDIEWEVYNKNENLRYIAQWIYRLDRGTLKKQFLLPLFPEDYEFEL